ncbi:uncharacterized protein A1O9_01283 [Exophiala aquamarina CBS 119918]|uniref:Globin-sensor domain-containing protein n=1 Tax=Exophiala aquamarina CBS 119918 TaxID=1182545 RepID=A0A072PTZ1_9EURO|nr:uncharacterized protein A1O9_01283 [Exophiala aquamarina CBS 119918]KEF63306.1 hypothetical protein A1O9_01283 [Exophiala aquamarina CBS 119918]
MHHIDAKLIETDLPLRMQYLQDFLLWDPAKDGSLIEACKPVLAPIVNNVVDAVYDHLLNFDITAAPFAPAQSTDGSGGSGSKVQDLHRDHANIKFRKDFLKAYLVRLVSNHDWTPQSKFWSYIDMVGKVHTGSMDSGLRHRKDRPALFVEYRDVNLLLGWVENAVTDIVMGVEALDAQTKLDVLKALNKFWWIQNDLFARHYVVSLSDRAAHRVASKGIKGLVASTNPFKPEQITSALLASASTAVMFGAYWAFSG